MKTLEGKLVSRDIKVGIVAARFNEFITSKLLSGAIDGVFFLGALIRGGTSHYELVWNVAAKGVAHVGLKTGVPVLFGVVTTDTIEQAIERAGTKAGNKGYDCATSAIEMVNLIRQIEA